MIDTFKLLSGKKELTIIKGEYKFHAYQDGNLFCVQISHTENNHIFRIEKCVPIRKPVQNYFNEMERMLDGFVIKKYPLVLLMDGVLYLLRAL